MSLATLSAPTLTKSELSVLLRRGINNQILRALEARQVPWQKPWEGRGEGVGYPREIRTKKRYFGINFLLLQMAAKEHGFVSSWWGTAEQFGSFGSSIKDRPANVVPGGWSTGTIMYRSEDRKILTTSSIVYNADQLNVLLEAYTPRSFLMPVYDMAEKILHGTNAQIKPNTTGEAWYYYPPHDYITLPQRAMFEKGLGGLPGYYESLAHELIHWTEPRLDYDTDCDEGERELRADIGAAMLVEELGVPHSISFSNYDKWYQKWINLMKRDENLIFKVCASASRAVDYILGFSMRVDGRFNQIDENVA